MKSGIKSFAIVNPFSGRISAESETIIRIKKAADNIGYTCYVISDEGYILNNRQEKTNEIVNTDELLFVISTHYLTPKTLDSFYYHTIWNPPEVPLDNVDYVQYAKNYLMNDDYLIYSSGSMLSHLKGLLLNKPRSLDNMSVLVASFPKSEIREPHFGSLNLFYCGMNWDVLKSGESRHSGLFKLLDESGCVKFYGPDIVKEWGNVRPWEGYKSYQFSIPFDGFSILDEINKCGIVLVLSSDVHRRAGAATNRLYEAITGGAVILSDENDFVVEHFKDAALFIDYNITNPRDTFSQIMEKYEWVKKNPEKAYKLVKKSQEIFINKFCLEKQLEDIINKHSQRVDAVKDYLYSKDELKRIAVILILDENKFTEILKMKINNAIKSFNNQEYKNIELVIAVDNVLFNEVKDYASSKVKKLIVIKQQIFNTKNVKIKTEGNILKDILDTIECDCFVNINPSEIWFTDHLSTLMRSLEDTDVTIASYSGRLRRSPNDTNVYDFFNAVSPSLIFQFSCFPVSGQILFKREALNYMDGFLFDSLDGVEHYALLLFALVKQNKKAVFSYRMSMSYYNHNTDYNKVNQIFDPIYSTRYFQDILRYKMVESGFLTDTSFQMYPGGFYDKYLKIPLKSWLLYRFYSVSLRVFGWIPGLSKILLKRKIKHKEHFNEKMKII